MKCRHCDSELRLSLIDLGSAPTSNAYLTEQSLREPEKWFPLRVLVCEHCWLVQTEDFAQAEELFGAEYAYFSGFSDSWLEHSKRYVNEMVERFNLNVDSQVVEVAANDGYLLQYVKALNIPCYGIEPTNSTANAARAKGIPIVEEFFGRHLAKDLVEKGMQVDLAVANNVLAHVPDINDFVAAFAMLLKPHGVVTFEFPHLLKLIEENQFDTIYHEHYSYLSITAVSRIFAANGLALFDVEEHPTHGGSLRVFAHRSETGGHICTHRVEEMLSREARAGINNRDFYADFQAKAIQLKNDFIDFLLLAKRQGKKVVAYGAAAKGNTLMNFAGIRPDLISFVVDRNPAKLGKYMPGSRIPIMNEEKIMDYSPDFVVILPWNIKTEVIKQLAVIHNWGGKFVIAVPKLTIIGDNDK